MVKRIGSPRRKTRKKWSRPIKEKGRLNITRYMQEFKNGDRVVLKAEPSYQEGLYYRRFHGRAGVVQSKQGNCYIVQIKDGAKLKSLIVHPVHLKRV